MDDKIIYKGIAENNIDGVFIRIYEVTQHGRTNSYLQIGDNHYITYSSDWVRYDKVCNALRLASAISQPDPASVQSVQHKALVRLAQLGADWDLNWEVEDRVLGLGIKIKLPDVECWRAYDDWEEVLADLK